MAEPGKFCSIRPKNRRYKLYMKTKNLPIQPEIAIQSLLRPAYYPSVSSKDYRDFHDTVDQLESLIRNSDLEKLAMEYALEGYERASGRQRNYRARTAVKALRFNSLRKLLGNPSLRELSKTIGGNDLLASFCEARQIEGIRGIAKSSLDRYAKFFTDNQIRRLNDRLTAVAGNPDMVAKIGMEEAVDTSAAFFDSTCIEANIHFPVDWVLLKDVASTLLQGIILIRKAGIRNRIPCEPKELMREMNRLCIEITHSGRRNDSKKKRKAVLRDMKQLLKDVGKHAQLHADRFELKWEQTDYSVREKDIIILRIKDMREQLPKVIKQAHERIIGERQVPNSEKILSVYERDIHVIKRGKAGKTVEFGNTLMLCEGLDGYILDWQFYKETAPGEAQQMQESLRRQGELLVPSAVESACSDRGFNSKENSQWLEEHEIFDATCPRNSSELKQRMKEQRFVDLQRRRGSTEGRIGIFKNRFQRGGLRSKGFENRNREVAWAVLGHNLWMLTRRLAAEDQARKKADRARAA